MTDCSVSRRPATIGVKPGNCLPEIFKNTFSFQVQQQVSSIFPPQKYQQVAALVGCIQSRRHGGFWWT